MPSEPTVARGSSGDAVMRLQLALIAAGFDTGEPDGIFGAKTEEAVKALQTASALTADGVAGPRTWAVLRSSDPASGSLASSGSSTTSDGSTDRAKPTTSLRLSDRGARFIGRFEGFRSQLYDDAAGHCTIGYGHLVHRGNCDGSEPAEFQAGITEQRAIELLQEDAAVAAAAINAAVAVPLEQHQFDALVSFVFNVGTGAFNRSTLLRRLNASDYDAVPSELNKWVNAGGQRLQGLVTRRAAEGALFQNGTY